MKQIVIYLVAACLMLVALGLLVNAWATHVVKKFEQIEQTIETDSD